MHLKNIDDVVDAFTSIVNPTSPHSTPHHWSCHTLCTPYARATATLAAATASSIIFILFYNLHSSTVLHYVSPAVPYHADFVDSYFQEENVICL
ncbi:hypothetical protein V9T40_000306 [Parthenolecanium corni]|uniref:Transmembrane protein n=1 Tax=Parthenolecanium corni TaxID=536013 RepID=A0AAN9T9A2_9HEMI